MAHCHGQRGAHRQAIDATERSVEAYRRAGAAEPGAYQAELAREPARASIRQRLAGRAGAGVAAGREALALTRLPAESDPAAHMLLVSERLLILGRALFHARAAAEALACCQEAESVLVGIDAGGDPERHRTALAAARSALAAALGDLVREHLAGARADDAVEALRQLLALTRRADSPDVHAVCLSAFSHAREQAADEVGRAWQRATADPFPTFVFRLPRGRSRD